MRDRKPHTLILHDSAQSAPGAATLDAATLDAATLDALRLRDVAR